MTTISSQVDDPAFRDYLDGLVRRYERPEFIAEDPVSVPHGFDDPGDREIVALFASRAASRSGLNPLTKA